MRQHYRRLWTIETLFGVNSSCLFVLASVTQNTGSMDCSSDQILFMMLCVIKVMGLMWAPATKTDATKIPVRWITPKIIHIEAVK